MTRIRKINSHRCWQGYEKWGTSYNAGRHVNWYKLLWKTIGQFLKKLSQFAINPAIHYSFPRYILNKKERRHPHKHLHARILLLSQGPVLLQNTLVYDSTSLHRICGLAFVAWPCLPLLQLWKLLEEGTRSHLFYISSCVG